jgi:multicomponent Na+:H+ antiporter subunit B
MEETHAEAVRVLGLLLFGFALVVGLWLVAFGYVTPGGGFQGGVLLAGSVLLLYLVWSYRAWHRATPEQIVDPVEATGAGGYLVIGLAALISGSAFLANLLGPGTKGTLLSSGSIGMLNAATALEVVGATVLLFREFLESHLIPIARNARA